MSVAANAPLLGHFTVQGSDQAGALKLDGPNTKLEIFSDDFLHLKDEEMACVRGVSMQGVSISALRCVPLVQSGSAGHYGKHKSFITLKPNFVVLGARYLEPDDEAIASVSFTFSEANNLFYDWGTFGHIIWKHRLSFGQLREILQDVKRAPRHRRRGGWLDLYYRAHEAAWTYVVPDAAERRESDITSGLAPAALDLQPRKSAVDRFVNCRRRIDRAAVAPHLFVPALTG